jgi:hypothetical protein
MNCPPQERGTPPFPSLYNPLLERYRDCEQPYASITYLENAGDIFRFTLYWTLIVYTPVFALPALWGLVVHFIPHRLSRRRRRNRDSGSGSTANLHFSALSLDRQNNAEILSPRSSEPFLLQSSTAPDSRDRTVRLENTTRRLAITQTIDSWKPNRTLRTFRRRRDDSFALAPTSPVPTTLSQPPVRRISQEPTSLRNRSTGVTCLILTIPLIFVIIGAVVGVVGSLVIGYLLAALRGTAGVKISTWLPLGWAVIQVHTVLLGYALCFLESSSY